jgi:GTP-binding protein HflX
VKVPYPTVALVGYTNAGKSTLFNYITKESVFAKDMLFATLDPTLRKVELGQGLEVILSDTVGFIADLPHELVMAFRATLEEVLEAEIILHVIDVSNPRYKEQRQDVLNVLHELGLEKIESTSRYFEVFNKIDLLQPTYTGEPIFKKNELAVSAVSGMGIDKLINTLREYFTQKNRIDTIKLAVSDGGGLAQIYRTSEVIERKEDENFIYLKVRHLSNKY